MSKGLNGGQRMRGALRDRRPPIPSQSATTCGTHNTQTCRFLFQWKKFVPIFLLSLIVWPDHCKITFDNKIVIIYDWHLNIGEAALQRWQHLTLWSASDMCVLCVNWGLHLRMTVTVRYFANCDKVLCWLWAAVKVDSPSTLWKMTCWPTNTRNTYPTSRLGCEKFRSVFFLGFKLMNTGDITIDALIYQHWSL